MIAGLLNLILYLIYEKPKTSDFKCFIPRFSSINHTRSTIDDIDKETITSLVSKIDRIASIDVMSVMECIIKEPVAILPLTMNMYLRKADKVLYSTEIVGIVHLI